MMRRGLAKLGRGLVGLLMWLTARPRFLLLQGDLPDVRQNHRYYDQTLLALSLGLMLLGLVMVTSASISVAENLSRDGNTFMFALRHAIFIGLGLTASAVMMRFPISFWQRSCPLLLMLGLIALLLVLFVGHRVNGSIRWVRLGPFSLQVSEFVKLFVIFYMASFMVRKSYEVQHKLVGFVKPLLVLSLISGLLLMEPDLGATAVIVTTALAMLLMGGAPVWQFCVIVVAMAAGLGFLIAFESYRMQRILGFMNPWEDPFGKGYQLTQSLIAYGRGEWTGQGLGQSIQKLSYLPEAHTDFVFAVLAEELGVLGVILVLSCFAVLLFRALVIGRTAHLQGQYFAGHVAHGIAIWFSLQIFINIGASSGLLPTKGLTLPLISYGGSSLLISGIAIGLLLRISYESRIHLMPVVEPAAEVSAKEQPA